MQFVHKAKEVNCKVSLLEHLSVVGEALSQSSGFKPIR